MCRSVSTYVLSPTALLRDGVKRMLDKTQFRVVAAADRFEHLKIVRRRVQPSLFIVFVEEICDEAEEVVGRMRAEIPDARIVLLTPSVRDIDILSAIRLGAHGYLVETISADALVKSLNAVMIDSLVLPLDVSRDLSAMPALPSAVRRECVIIEPVEPVISIAALNEPRWSGSPSQMPALSDREALILRALIKGESNKHIARDLDIAEATVKVHVKAILRKFRVRNRTQAAIWAISNGEAALAPPPPHSAETVIAAVGA